MHGELILPDLERLKEEQKLASVRGPLSSLILIRRALETGNITYILCYFTIFYFH